MKVRLLKRIALFIEKKQNSLFSYSVKKQENYIKHFPEPKDGIERGYFQYRCQMKMHGGVLSFFMNLFAFPLYFLLLFKLRRAKKEGEEKREEQAIFFDNGISLNIVPDSLWKEFGNIECVSNESNYITKEDKAFLRRIIMRYPFACFFWLKILIKLSQYSMGIRKYFPKAIICCDEFSFTSSVLTEYCRIQNVELINVMHGEKLFFMRDSFVCYDRYYVWDRYYVELLVQLRAEKKQFRIEIPKSMIFDNNGTEKTKYDYKYYLAAEEEPVLKIIADTMQKLKERGCRVAIRPHPRYTDNELVSMLFVGIEVENASEKAIEDSLNETKAAISLYSTVLNQAYHNGVTVVIDDVSNVTQFEKLRELRYIMLEKEYINLSEIVEKIE